MGLFGEFEEVTSYDAAGKLDLSAMLRRTKDCLSRGVENICEASFSWDGNYCAVDVLHRQGDGYAVYEVESSTNSASEPAEPEELRHYAWDIAYQKYVNHSDSVGGGTIGAISSAMLPIRTVDMGMPLLAMHSSRELMGVKDYESLVDYLTAYYSL